MKHVFICIVEDCKKGIVEAGNDSEGPVDK